MIKDSDYCIFYYDKNYIAKHRYKIDITRKSGTKVAYEFAIKCQKKIINLFEN